MLVRKPPNANVVRSMWLFRHKYLADGSLSRYKAWLVANRSTQKRKYAMEVLEQAHMVSYNLSRTPVDAESKLGPDGDLVSAIYLTTNPVQHQWTKHIEIDVHFVRDMVTRGQVHVFHAISVPTSSLRDCI
uniref:Ribonuclease H-like domain-containing protein n=1 Tax=Tanacetum cinerariifolium TaxID=118510 RepID=A0A6L2N2M8_TANCI|nr:ribonuclease H-like domain-containing protein [Tanacetum cinerariifolium]